MILERLAVGLNVTLATLFEMDTESEVASEPVQRRACQSEWRDPETGYVRRNLSPPNVPQPLQLVEIEFPAKARVVFESQGRDVAIYQQFVMLEGTIETIYENQCHRINGGDGLALVHIVGSIDVEIAREVRDFQGRDWELRKQTDWKQL